MEQMCDEERYRALHTNEDEEEMYREEELKRLHAAGYGQVGFTYDTTPSEPPPAPTEVDEPYTPAPEFVALFPDDIVMPDTIKLNAIIDKTAKFIASQGLQMEILLRAKQADNPQFNFLNKDTPLNKYYLLLINLYKTGKWPPKKQEEVEEPHRDDEYLHPSLGTTFIESAPSIPSIHYKPSADCDYTMLICKIKGEVYRPTDLSPSKETTPGTELKLPQPHIARGPVLYTKGQPDPPQKKDYKQPAFPASTLPAKTPETPPVINKPSSVTTPSKSTGLSLMKNYNTDSDSDSDSNSTSSAEIKKPSVPTPPEEIQTVIKKMAAYVARNGDEFADIVRAKNDPRFTFLEPGHAYYAYYRRLMLENRIENCNGDSKNMGPVSFSIKKQKEPDPVLPRPALPYESSSDDDNDEPSEEKVEERIQVSTPAPNPVPPVVVYRIEPEDKPTQFYSISEIVHEHVENTAPIAVKDFIQRIESPKVIKESTPVLDRSDRRDLEERTRREKKKKRKRRRDYPRTRSRDRTERRHKKSSERSPNRNSGRRKEKKKEDCDVIISLEEGFDDFIDLTDDLAEPKAECNLELERSKQIERRKRAAEFLKKVGVDPAAASLPTSSLASAMVDTLETLKKKKEVEERRRKREKRKRRSRYDNYSSDEDYKRSKRRYKSKDRKHNNDEYESLKRKRRTDKKQATTEAAESNELQINLISTLKELRSSPTRAFLPDVEVSSPPKEVCTSSDDEVEKKMKKREYSEGMSPLRDTSAQE